MIHNGRRRKTLPAAVDAKANHHAAQFTAIIGIVVFTVFLCTSVRSNRTAESVSANFGEGAYQVFASTDTAPSHDKDASVAEDASIWSYLESVIFYLIYGDS